MDGGLGRILYNEPGERLCWLGSDQELLQATCGLKSSKHTVAFAEWTVSDQVWNERIIWAGGKHRELLPGRLY